ncbi:hypothetical protein QI204_11025 [Staphylococcus saprophyticus]|uniref:hypothetical protein n=1 Tax=Staphylococcus saprophyticus TaxID=29385 RepID=UPI000852AA86|nr:hypothetical protein [Staphylococcus saprophyticus]MDW4342479.1 hypothetical protein [Staphylococcus saprophyticus]OEK45569.1 hypothetical protein ASS92_06330 [Staphylococcus saprophyticus]QDX06766.1 hypothetical protein DV527_12135 [Staphylococcus saprophyticus]UUY79450.1 hypothetical protein NUT40_05170 [Staphylococcus saprophyticus]
MLNKKIKYPRTKLLVDLIGICAFIGIFLFASLHMSIKANSDDWHILFNLTGDSIADMVAFVILLLIVICSVVASTILRKVRKS